MLEPDKQGEGEGICAPVMAGSRSGVTEMLIPFSKLYLSDANVRKTRNDQEDAQLSADIEARGLLQNLLVTKSKKRGQYAVIAGGRRLPCGSAPARPPNSTLWRAVWPPLRL